MLFYYSWAIKVLYTTYLVHVYSYKQFFLCLSVFLLSNIHTRGCTNHGIASQIVFLLSKVAQKLVIFKGMWISSLWKKLSDLLKLYLRFFRRNKTQINTNFCSCPFMLSTLMTMDRHVTVNTTNSNNIHFKLEQNATSSCIKILQKVQTALI